MNDRVSDQAEASSVEDVSDARLGGLLAFHRQRKQDSRARLLAAAIEQFCKRGYFSVSVEDIASAAGVSRVTFYRHFSSKAALTLEVFKDVAAPTIPLYLAISERDFLDRVTVREWIAEIFAADQSQGSLLRVFTQATADEVFTARAQRLISDLIEGLGARIPAFDIAPQEAAQSRSWHEAWLLLYEILDQSNHAALGSGVAGSPVVIDILADRFLAFAKGGRS